MPNSNVLLEDAWLVRDVKMAGGAIGVAIDREPLSATIASLLPFLV